MKSSNSLLAAGSVLALAASPLLAHNIVAGKITINHPWTRETATAQSVGGGFMAINNRGKTNDRLVSASSPLASEVQIHTMSMEGGVMKMRQLKAGVIIPTGKTVEFRPGGLHVMFIGLKQPFRQGTQIPATLKFERAGSVKVSFTVQPVGASTPMEAGHAGH